MDQIPFFFERFGGDRLSDFDLVAKLPGTNLEKDDLLSILQISLSFPDYFGRNWDALDECLRDLHWIDGSRVLISHHAGFRVENEKDFAIYLDCLMTGVNFWKSRDRGMMLLVSFDPEDEKKILTVLKNSNR